MTHDRIEINPVVMFGKPVIKGTRITVEHILHKIAGGMTVDEILVDHPHLSPLRRIIWPRRKLSSPTESACEVPG